MWPFRRKVSEREIKKSEHARRTALKENLDALASLTDEALGDFATRRKSDIPRVEHIRREGDPEQ